MKVFEEFCRFFRRVSNFFSLRGVEVFRTVESSRLGFTVSFGLESRCSGFDIREFCIWCLVWGITRYSEWGVWR